jgi:hypothetical protein
MIGVKWPMDWPQGDAEVCDWLEELVKQSPGVYVFEYKSGCGIINECQLYFEREEDAIAFKLRFGV